MKIWPKMQFCEVARVVTGNTPPRADPESYGGSIPWVKPPDLDTPEPITRTAEYLTEQGAKKARLLPTGTVMVGCIGRVGIVGIAGTECATNQQINSLVFGPKVLPKFGYYVCVCLSPIIKARAGQAVVPLLNKGDFEQLEMPVPDLREQARIVELLDEADALRRQRVEADTKLARLLPALFRHHFGDPAQNPKKFRAARLRSLAQRYSDGPFGSNLKSDHYSPNGVRVIRLQNIGVGELLDDDKAYISEEHFASLDKHQCLPGDVLIGTMGDPNLRACIQPQSLKVALNKADCVQFRADDAQCTAEYICWLLNSPSTLGMAGSMVAGQTRARISMGRLGELEVPVPPLDLQKRFSLQVKLSNPLLTHAAASAAKLETLFQVLLHRAFTGELTAKWREAHLREGVQEMTRAARS